MKIGIIGSRRRASETDLIILERKFVDILRKHYPNIDNEGSNLKKVLKNLTIVTGDCEEGGDFFALYLSTIYRCKLDVKYKKNEKTGEKASKLYLRNCGYYAFTRVCYSRNKEVAKEALHYLLALVSKDRTGGTENTIGYFKKYHEDWERKLILL